MTNPFIRNVNSNDRHHLANLIHFESKVHRHLDWRHPLDWIKFRPFLIAEVGKDIVAALACPPDPPEIAWIHLLAISSEISAEDAWSYLWSNATVQLTARNNVVVSAIPRQEWFQHLLQKSGFTLTNNVIMLLYERGNLPPKHQTTGIIIRPMNFDDLPIVVELDRSSFAPVWRNSQASLECAFRQAAVATVAEFDNNIVGYQISTGNHHGGHLARLAIKPQYQRRGIGYSLIRDMLDQFERRGARNVTVNTQLDNPISLSLYKKMGFQRTKEIYPVYQFELQTSISEPPNHGPNQTISE